MPIEYTIIISFVSVVCTVIGVSIGMTNLRRNSKLDDRHENTQFARVGVQLEYIAKSVSEILYDMNDIKNEIKEHRDRILRTEESTKQAHKRIDEIAGHKRGDLSGLNI